MMYEEFMTSSREVEFNSNNGWGFGGSEGTRYTYADFEYVQRRLHYRHNACNLVNEYFIDGDEVSKEVFIIKLNNI